MRSEPIDPSADVIDSRDVIARIAWHEIDEEDIDADAAGELAELRALAAECEGINSEWQYGVYLVADGYFVDHVRDEVMELNSHIYRRDAKPFKDDPGVPVDWAAFPFSHIDWSAAAEERRRSYSSVTFGGRTFWLEDGA